MLLLKVEFSADCGGIRIHSLYVPNGREPDSDHYRYKLDWLAALRDVVAAGPSDVTLCGDMNIAPTDADVYDPAKFVDSTHTSPAERAALADLESWGLVDTSAKTVKNIKSITQLPLTGAAGTMLFTVVALLVAGAGVTIAIKSRQNAEA